MSFETLIVIVVVVGVAPQTLVDPRLEPCVAGSRTARDDVG